MLFSRSSERSHVEFGVYFTSKYAGYLTLPGYEEVSVYTADVNISYSLLVPSDRSVAMLSVWPISVLLSWCTGKTLEVFAELGETVYATAPSLRHDMTKSKRIFILNGHLRFHFERDCLFRYRYRAKIMFSFHSRSESPPSVLDLEKGTANCSTPLYGSFRQHIHCDLIMNCQSGEDERGCPHTSPDCDGHLFFLNKCYAFMLPSERDTSSKIRNTDTANPCVLRGWSVVGVRDMEEYKALGIYLGMVPFVDVTLVINVTEYYPRLLKHLVYRNLLMNGDRTVNYFLPVKTDQRSHPTPFMLLHSQEIEHMTVSFTDCEKYPGCIYFCEFSHRFFSPPSRTLGTPNLVSHLLYTFLQTSGHVFSLASYKNASGLSAEDVTSDAASGALMMQQCWLLDVVFAFMPCGQQPGNGGDSFDCKDESDESFCLHPKCGTMLRCGTTHQCVPISAWCNSHPDCRLGDDEYECVFTKWPSSLGDFVPPPAAVHYDTKHGFTKTPLRDFEGCPDTHFQCPSSYCVPAFVVCNDISDCPGHEDEAFCENYDCVGYYRCHRTYECVHPVHLCDGINHCPLMDDESTCDAKCPRECLCRGFSALCSRPFHVHQLAHLRYVDGSGTQMSAEDFNGNRYIIFLRLAKCRLESVDVLHLPNLQILDLMDNRIQSLRVDSFVRLTNLKQLLLSGNPIATVEQNDPGLTQSSLWLVDMSQSEIHVFDSRPFLQFEKITTLNLSFSPLSTVNNDGFQHIPSLEVLDVRSTQLESFPSQVFLGLTKLSKIYADNYKLCCKATLPEHFSSGNCLAPVNELSSCEDLLRSDIYRACLWMFAVMATVGNIGSVVFKMWFQKENKGSGFNLFVILLSVTDMCMGLYLVLIGIADARYRGQYLWYDVLWKHSILCQTAGFFALFSAEASAFIVLLITVDRFIVFKFPFSDVRFNSKSALVACGLVCLSCGVLAGVPLLSVTSHWEYYSQTGICIPLPITRKDFAGRNYSFAVMIVLNLAVFLLIAAGQVSIYLSIHRSSMDASSSSESSAIRKTRDAAIVRRLSAVVVSDFLCWFPVGLLGVMSTAGMPIPGWLNVAVAILILPINSAMNPFLYTYNVLMETRRRVLKAERKIIMDRILKNFKENLQNVTADTVRESSRVRQNTA